MICYLVNVKAYYDKCNYKLENDDNFCPFAEFKHHMQHGKYN
ncbi:MAG: hypothetical protein K0Q79_3263 [Flavipsychrobacter sp.]|nr:hypothetical protein [Flavipsychrobacter sp.]